MQPADRDSAYLWDMLQACREIRGFMQGVKRADFMADRKLCLAIERALEIMGEAARRVSDKFQTDHPQIPWHRLRGMRNVLAHEYGQIDHEIIYKTVTDEVPKLTASLEALLPKR